MIAHLEPYILECEVKWALGSITTNKASRGNGIPVEIFQILKDAAAKVLHSICQQTWKNQQWPQDWKRSFFIPTPKKSNVKGYSSYHTFALISHASKRKESEVIQSCLTLCNPMNCSLPCSSIHGFSRQEYWSGLPFPSPGDLPEPGIEPGSPTL